MPPDQNLNNVSQYTTHGEKENNKWKIKTKWWKPRWFLPVKNEHTKENDWKYVGDYWGQKQQSDGHKCDVNIPDIF